MNDKPLLSVKNLQKYFVTERTFWGKPIFTREKHWGWLVSLAVASPQRGVL